jgi:dipeptidase E
MTRQNLLLLSTSRFLIDHQKTFRKPFSDMRMAYVTTASKGTANTEYIDRAKTFFDGHGYDYEELDIDGKDVTQLRSILKGFEIVFVEGGNSFYLLKSIRESGFDTVIKELLPQGLIYMGASAGSYVTCPTIDMATWKHQDKYDHYGVEDLTAMNLVPFLVTAHYKPEYRDLLKEKIGQSRFPVRILDDGQALLVQDGQVELIGEGAEISL